MINKKILVLAASLFCMNGAFAEDTTLHYDVSLNNQSDTGFDIVLDMQDTNCKSSLLKTSHIAAHTQIQDAIFVDCDTKQPSNNEIFSVHFTGSKGDFYYYPQNRLPTNPNHSPFSFQVVPPFGYGSWSLSTLVINNK